MRHHHDAQLDIINRWNTIPRANATQMAGALATAFKANDRSRYIPVPIGFATFNNVATLTGTQRNKLRDRNRAGNALIIALSQSMRQLYAGRE